MDQIQNIWQGALRIIEGEISDVSFGTWIEPLRPYAVKDRDFILLIGDPFYKDMVEKRYIGIIKNALRQVTSTDYNILVHTDEQPAENYIRKEEEKKLALDNLNPKYVFSSFVVGNSNRFAHAASLAVAEAPGKAYNPLFIYGDVGLGKTHLMQSIAHYILNRKPSTKIIYTSSETFTNEVIKAIAENKTEDLRNKFRNIDVLLVDDIQFIAKKISTQEEFFHTFNALYESGKQIIISSDRPPNEINPLENRLKSRFGCGLIADIQPPDYETRVAILHKKAEREGLSVPNDVMEFIANSIVSNIRELEGALTRIVAYSTLTANEVNLDSAQIALKNIYNMERQISVDLIQEIVANHFHIQKDDIKGSKKPKSIAYPRQIAMYLSRKLLDISLPKIGQKFGGRDHTTVIHACTKIEKEIEQIPETASLISELERKIKEK